jgi:hypothetical protein
MISRRKELGEGDSPHDVVSMVPLTQFECAESSELPSPRHKGVHARLRRAMRGEGTATSAVLAARNYAKSPVIAFAQRFAVTSQQACNFSHRYHQTYAHHTEII